MIIRAKLGAQRVRIFHSSAIRRGSIIATQQPTNHVVGFVGAPAPTKGLLPPLSQVAGKRCCPVAVAMLRARGRYKKTAESLGTALGLSAQER